MSLYFLRAEVQNKLHQDKDYPCEVVGSWTTWYGEQDQAGKQKGRQKIPLLHKQHHFLH